MLQLLGLLLPPFIDIINRRIKDSDIRFFVSVVFCSAIGLLVHGFQGGSFSDFEGVSASLLTVFGAAQFSFKLIYDESPMRNKLLK